MDAPPEIVQLADAQIPELADVLARAFVQDPFFVHALPDEPQRVAALPLVMRMIASYCQRNGECYTTSGTVRGGATWQAPGSASSREQWEAAGFGRAAAAMGGEAVGRMLAALEDQTRAREQVMPERYWYLMLLGVDPPWQGRGIGGHLMQPILDRAAAERLPCYLETATVADVRFYTRYGFTVAVEGDVPGTRFHYWGMSRPPQAA
jgi:GNAT superfamily N-acetyltransferase